MNRALFFLYSTLAKRQALRFLKGLAKPARLIGFLMVLAIGFFIYQQRDQEAFQWLMEKETLIFLGTVLTLGSVVRGFFQRGLPFQPADIEFLFTRPFERKHLILYRLLPAYFYSFASAVVFYIIFGMHMQYPLVGALCFMFVQISLFQISTCVSIYAGSLDQDVYIRQRRMLVGFLVFLIVGALIVLTSKHRTESLYSGFGEVISSTYSYLLFFPLITPVELDLTPMMGSRFIEIADSLGRTESELRTLWLFLAGMIGLSYITLLVVRGFRSNIFENSVAATEEATRVRDRGAFEHRGTSVTPSGQTRISFPLIPFCVGGMAIVWKNAVAAMRSKREMIISCAWTAAMTISWLPVIQAMHDEEDRFAYIFTPLWVAMLPFLLQRSLPFDFRSDGRHFVELKVLPVRPETIVLAELAVPTILAFGFQVISVVLLSVFGQVLPLKVYLIMLLGFPLVNLAINAVWNARYLLFAMNQSGTAPSMFGTLLVLALSIGVFAPAVYAYRGYEDILGKGAAAATAFLVQVLVDLFLIYILARKVGRFEVLEA